MLLDILSNGNRPWVVATQITNICGGIKSLAKIDLTIVNPEPFTLGGTRG